MSVLKTPSLALALLLMVAFTGIEKRSAEIGKLKYEYETANQRFDGLYTSYYANGQKKASGSFENNCRTGTWTIWDKNGKVKIKREYQTPFNYNQLIPTNSSSEVYSLKKGEGGFIEYYDFKQDDILWSKRIWRNIPAAENPALFNQDHLFMVLFELGLNGAIQLYTTDNDEFRKKVDLATFAYLDLNNKQVVEYEIKEETFYDKARKLSETRIIGICPILKDKTTGKKEKLFWVYYPETRVYLAYEKPEGVVLPEKIKSIDDLFFYRCFYGQIVKESNVKDLRIDEYKKSEEAILKEAEKIELRIIEAEHDLWLND
ncbi:MAG: hypothetical protein CL840_10890 [Crocinitomicaceae bacterium]|nr:hypothetical protein [Crocinitomicaceae bacterium]|tara:strand:+ start:7141 stop:8091 length:951 start_codon:yes stop_codon:yes gene_type:complete